MERQDTKHEGMWTERSPNPSRHTATADLMAQSVQWSSYCHCLLLPLTASYGQSALALMTTIADPIYHCCSSTPSTLHWVGHKCFQVREESKLFSHGLGGATLAISIAGHAPPQSLGEAQQSILLKTKTPSSLRTLPSGWVSNKPIDHI